MATLQDEVEESNIKTNISTNSSVECEVGSNSGDVLTASQTSLHSMKLHQSDDNDKEEGEEGEVLDDQQEGVLFEKDEDIVIMKEKRRPTTTLATSKRLITSSSSNVYIPPSKRKQMLEASQNISTSSKQNKYETLEYQKENWNKLRKSINGTINRLHQSNIKELISSLFQSSNLLAGRGILVKSLLKASHASPCYSNIYAALIAVINTKLPEIGELCVKRCILTVRRCYKRRDKQGLICICIFIGHLLNQHIVHELLVLEIITLLLDGDEPSDDSVEVCIELLQVIGKELYNSSPKGLDAIFSRLRNILHEGNISKRIQISLERLFKVKSKLSSSQDNDFSTSIMPQLDLVDEDDQITFELSLDEEHIKKEEYLDVFRYDEHFERNQKVWFKIRDEILGVDTDDNSGTDDDDDDDDDGSTTASSSSEEEQDEDEPEEEEQKQKSKILKIEDLTETILINLRRTIYLTIMSSASFEECAHKLTQVTKDQIPIGAEHELINMIIECCSQERTYLKYYGFISARFCLLEHGRWSNAFSASLEEQYNTIHRLETNKLRNVAKLFAHLLTSDSLNWNIFHIIHLNENETTSSSRIFLKIILQTMAEYIGVPTLQKRFNVSADIDFDKVGEEDEDNPFRFMFPMDNPRDTRYAINFYTSIGLGPLTDGLREYLKIAPKLIMERAKKEQEKQLLLDEENREKKKLQRGRSDSFSSSGSSSSSSSGSSRSSSSSRSSYSSRSRSSYSSSSSSNNRSYTSSSSSYSSSSYSSDDDSRRHKRNPSRRHRRPTRSVSFSSQSSTGSRPKKSSSRKKHDKNDNSTPLPNNKGTKGINIEDKNKNTDVKRSISPRKKDDYNKEHPASNNSPTKNDDKETKNLPSPSKDKVKDSKNDDNKKDSKKHHRSRRRRSYSSASSSSASSRRSSNGSMSGGSSRRHRQSKKKQRRR